MVTGEAHNHVGGARIRKTPEKLSRTDSWASVADLPSAHHGSRLPEIILEKPADPLFGAAGILVDRQCQ